MVVCYKVMLYAWFCFFFNFLFSYVFIFHNQIKMNEAKETRRKKNKSFCFCFSSVKQKSIQTDQLFEYVACNSSCNYPILWFHTSISFTIHAYIIFTEHHVCMPRPTQPLQLYGQNDSVSDLSVNLYINQKPLDLNVQLQLAKKSVSLTTSWNYIYFTIDGVFIRDSCFLSILDLNCNKYL